MAENIHVKKLENTETERAVQVRTSDPVGPLDTQLWFNRNDSRLSIFTNGAETRLNVRVLPADPLSPQLHEVWINSTTNELKYFDGAAVKILNIGGGTTGGTFPAGSFLQILTEAELQNIKDINFPDFLIDAFLESKGSATFVNVSAIASALRVNVGETSGAMTRSMESSTKVNSVDGIAVVTPNGHRPKTVTDNANDTHTLVFDGDTTTAFPVNSNLLLFKLIDVDGTERSRYALDGASRPAVMNVNSSTYNIGPNETEVIIDTPPTIDLLAQLGVLPAEVLEKIRVYPYNLSFKAGGEGSSGTKDTIPVIGAHGLEINRGAAGDPLVTLTENLPGGVIYVRANQSPSGQFAIATVLHQLPSSFGEWVFYYTTDGWQTINEMQSRFPYTGQTFDEVEESNQLDPIHKETIQILDSGQFFMTITQTGSWIQRGTFGNLSDPNPFPELVPSFSGTLGTIWNSETTTYTNAIGLDPDGDWVFVAVVNRSNSDMHITYYKDGGATLIAFSPFFDDNLIALPGRGRVYTNFEGEKQFVHVSYDPNSGYTNFYKKKISEAQNEFDTFGQTNNVGGRFVMRPFFDNESRAPIVNSFGTYYPAAILMTDEYIHLLMDNDSEERMNWASVDMQAPDPGLDEIQDITFDAVPDAGQWQIEFNTATTSLLGPTATSTQVETALNSLATIDQVIVTGDMTAGFTVQFTGSVDGKQPQPLMTVPTPTNTLTASAVPVNANVTETQNGVLPIFPTFSPNGRQNDGTGDMIRMTGLNHHADHFSQGHVNHQSPDAAGNYNTQIIVQDPNDPKHVYFTYTCWHLNGSFDDGRVFLCEIDDVTQNRGLDLSQDFSVASFNQTVAIAEQSHTGIGTWRGTKVAQKISVPTSGRIRSIGVHGYLTWGSSPFHMPERFKDAKMTLKIVGVAGNVPDETNLVDTSPDELIVNDLQFTNRSWDNWWRVKIDAAPGTEFYAVWEVTGFDVTVDWNPADGGQPGYVFFSTSTTGGGGATFDAGLWTARDTRFTYMISDMWMCQLHHVNQTALETADVRQFTTLSSSYGGTESESALQMFDATRMMAVYMRNSTSSQSDGRNFFKEQKLYSRLITIQPPDTYPIIEKREMIGYDDTLVDPYLLIQTRLGSPDFDRRFMRDGLISGHRWRNIGSHGDGMTWSGGAFTDLASQTQGPVEDSNFRSGWKMIFNNSGHVRYTNDEPGSFGFEDWIMEFEIEPRPSDLSSATIYHDNTIQLYISGGFLHCGIGILQGSGIPTTISNEGMTTEYQVVRVMRDNSLIRMFRDIGDTGTFTEFTYSQQGQLQRRCITHSSPDRYIGSNTSNGDNWEGGMGEVRIAVGTTTFKNPVGTLIPSQPLGRYCHLGDKIICHRHINMDPSTTNDRLYHEAVIARPKIVTAQIPVRDQLLEISKDNIPEGQEPTVEIEIQQKDIAVQGYLVNYERK